MSKSEVKIVSRIKTKRKTWHTVLASAVFGKKELGESFLGSPEEAVGRFLKINLKDLTGNMRDQNAYVSFKIVKWQGSTLDTIHTGYELTSASVKRMVKKNCNRLDDYFLFMTKDNKPLVVKTLMFTIKKISRSIRTQLRKVLKEILAEEFKKNNWQFLIVDVLTELGATDLTKEERIALSLPEESEMGLLIKKAYEILGLITFLTTGPDETRAWTLKKGYLAPQAGGAIHTDFESHFIKAEVINWQTLLEAGGFVRAREKGLIRTEGKEYLVQDGDVIEIKHNA